ncbi:MAG: WhiB family transcriptional regulator [Sciscionella sp.]
MGEQDRFRHIADRLERLAAVPTGTLGEAVIRHGVCMSALTEGDPPELTGVEGADRELAARLCSGCPVQEQCLELELRWSGAHTIGVFGALPEQDRRALYPHWRARRISRGGERR